MNSKNYKNKTGFTLIELLIVVLIISILAGLLLTVINPTGIRKKTRDAQRKSDIKRIQTALELYFADNRHYPDQATGYSLVSAGAINSGLKPTYLNNIPTDPGVANSVNTGDFSGNCTDTNFGYSYKSSAGGASYILVARMEVQTSAADSNCFNLNNKGSVGLTCPSLNHADNNCYGAENP